MGGESKNCLPSQELQLGERERGEERMIEKEGKRVRVSKSERELACRGVTQIKWSKKVKNTRKKCNLACGTTPH